jgi:hypothetical protein
MALTSCASRTPPPLLLYLAQRPPSTLPFSYGENYGSGNYVVTANVLLPKLAVYTSRDMQSWVFRGLLHNNSAGRFWADSGRWAFAPNGDKPAAGSCGVVAVEIALGGNALVTHSITSVIITTASSTTSSTTPILNSAHRHVVESQRCVE